MNISFRLQSGKAQYIAKGGKVGRKPEEDKRKQYAGVLRLLGKGYPMKVIADTEGVSVSTVQRLKKEFGL